MIAVKAPEARHAAARPALTAYIGLGANLGDPAATLRVALHELGAQPGVSLLRVSAFYRTRPLDAGGPDYVNAVAEISTTRTAPQLLDALQALEAAFGRERPYRNAPRTLDLDLLLYGDGHIDSPRLTVPHPRMRERAFVLQPLADLAPERVDAAWLAATAEQGVSRL